VVLLEIILSSDAKPPRKISSIEFEEIFLPGNTLRTGLGDVKELADSIDKLGLLHPIVLRPIKVGFELVAGNRRFKACRRLGWSHIPCIVVDLNDKEAFEVALTENVQRKTLNPVEEANAFKRYVTDFGWGGVTDLAVQIGKSPQYVCQRLKLLSLPSDILGKLEKGSVTPSLLREITGLEDDVQRSIVEMAVTRNFSSRRVGRLAKKLRNSDNPFEFFQDDSSFRSEFDRNLLVSNRLFKRCIMALKYALFEFDDVINDVGDEEKIRGLLMKQRRNLHDQIDILLKSKKRLRTLLQEMQRKNGK